MANHSTQLSLVYRFRPARQPSAASPSPLLILLHGYGSNEDDLLGLSSYLDPRFNLLSARAPLPLGTRGFAWFPIAWDEHGFFVRPDEVMAAVETAARFVAEAMSAFGSIPERTLFLGFSQGAAMSAGVLMHQPTLTAGAVLMSGFLPDGLQPVNVRLDGKRLLITHGLLDDIVPVSMGRAARESLASLGAAVTYREYPIAHQISEAALEDVDQWLSEALP
jgi:phospholipase/carboxylesterase